MKTIFKELNLRFEKGNGIDWTDKFLFLCGIYVHWYWLLREVRKEYFKGNLTNKKALDILGVEK